MSDSDHERSAELCRQAALPILRQRPAIVAPDSTPPAKDSHQSQELREEPKPADFGGIRRFHDGDPAFGVWFRPR